ncbi:MAG: hypothetical protein Q8R72_00710 [Hylemonella sp.]|nr:hypothetical protein [Hylemonella sp.]
MRKRLIALLLVLLNVWQVASAAGLPQLLAAQGQALDHAVMHWQGEAHHHDDHGVVHADGSQDSIQHMMADCCFHHLAVFQAPSVVALESLPQQVAQTAQPVPPPPHLDGLRRPPRLLS